MVFRRALKHASRALSKPFQGVNKTNLVELAKVVGQIQKVRRYQRKYPDYLIADLNLKLKYGQFNFTWILSLDENQFYQFLGEWDSHAPAGKSMSQYLVSDTQTNISDDEWAAMQDTKARYRAIAKAASISTFGRIAAKVRRAGRSVEDRIYHNRLFSEYLTAAETLNNLYAIADRKGAASEFEDKVLTRGGILKVLLAGAHVASSATKLSTSLGTASSRPIIGPIKDVTVSSVKLLDNLGGLLIGLGQLMTKSETSFQSLSGRTGLKQRLFEAQKRILGGVSSSDAGPLAGQVPAGPQALQRGGDALQYDLTDLKSQFRHAIWWCEMWKADLKTVEREIAKPDYIHQLQQISLAHSGDDILRPSEAAAAGAATDLAARRDELMKTAAKLRKKINTFQEWLEPQLKELEVLTAGVATRRDIAEQQALLRSAGVNFDATLELSKQIAAFDRAALNPVAGTESQVRKKVEESFMERAMRERREAMGYAA